MKTRIYGLLLICGTLFSCNDFLGVEQKGQVIPQTVEDYDEMMNLPVSFGDVQNLNLMIPELYLTDNLLGALNIHQINGYKWEPYQYLADENDEDYTELYKRIYVCNEVINNIDKAVSRTKNELLRQQVKGWALADRARCYWALVNLYGQPYSAANRDKLGVSLIFENNISQQSVRATVGEVYDQICRDLRQAAGLVPEKVPENKKIKATRQGVEAFRARVFLYMNEIDSAMVAIRKATETDPVLLDYNNFVAETDLQSTTYPWKGNGTRPTQARVNPEIIWHVGVFYYIFSFNTIYVTQGLIDLFNTDASAYTDLRYVFDYGTVDPITGGKEKDRVCYFACGQDRSYMPSAPDIYLLKAEILARKGDFRNAMITLNELRKHRFLNGSAYELTASDAATALKYVKQERAREFACTFLTWFDLRRYQAYGETVPAFTRSIGSATLTLEPGSNLYTLSIPRYVITKNPKIVQNPR